MIRSDCVNVNFSALDGVLELHRNATRNNESTVLEPFVQEDQLTGYDATYVRRHSSFVCAV